MLGFFSKMFGGSKSEKDVKSIAPLVAKINQNFQTYQSLSNDQLRQKTQEFRQRIKDHLKEIEEAIEGYVTVVAGRRLPSVNFLSASLPV